MERVQSCTIYDCEFDIFLEGVIEKNNIYVINENGNKTLVKDSVCEHVDYGMVQFFIGYINCGNKSKKGTAKWGYFNILTSEIVVPPTYEEAHPFYGNRAKVKKDDKYGLIDPNGNIVVQCIWDDIRICEKDIYAVRKDDK